MKVLTILASFRIRHQTKVQFANVNCVNIGVLGHDIGMDTLKGPDPKPYHHGDLKDELMRLGEEALENNQLAQLSLRSLAKQAGVSHSAPYRHFKNKKALEEALLLKEMDQLVERVNHLKRRNVSAEVSLLSIGQYLCELAAEHPSRFQLLASPESENPPARLMSLRDQVFKELLRWVVGFLHDSGQRSQFQPVELTKSVWTGLFGCACLARSHWLSVEVDGASEALKILKSFLHHVLKKSDQ